jgi:hypothetical protein
VTPMRRKKRLIIEVSALYQLPLIQTREGFPNRE